MIVCGCYASLLCMSNCLCINLRTTGVPWLLCGNFTTDARPELATTNSFADLQQFGNVLPVGLLHT